MIKQTLKEFEKFKIVIKDGYLEGVVVYNAKGLEQLLTQKLEEAGKLKVAAFKDGMKLGVNIGKEQGRKEMVDIINKMEIRRTGGLLNGDVFVKFEQDQKLLDQIKKELNQKLR